MDDIEKYVREYEIRNPMKKEVALPSAPKSGWFGSRGPVKCEDKCRYNLYKRAVLENDGKNEKIIHFKFKLLESKCINECKLD